MALHALCLAGYEAQMFKRILVAYDGSEGSKDALRAGLAMGQDFNAEVCAISVEGKLPRYAATLGEVDEVERERHQYFDRIQAEATQIADEHGVKLGTVVAPGAPAETIVKTAREGKYDLIVMGHKGHSRVHEYLVGATTDRVSHLAPCSVLIVRERENVTG
jgi:nucleotide-binding universal stress UspA family protein